MENRVGSAMPCVPGRNGAGKGGKLGAVNEEAAGVLGAEDPPNKKVP